MHDMIEMLTDAMGDAVKHDKGNKAAGTRVRKAMQEAKATAQAHPCASPERQELITRSLFRMGEYLH